MRLSLVVTACMGALPLACCSGDHHKCACEAEEFGFTIDCSDGDAMLAALAALQANDCDEDCGSKECEKNFLIIQSHHDYCLHDEVPEPVEDSFHTFEDVCEECEIVRKPDPSLPDCPTATCGDDGNDAFQALLTSGCLDDCSTSTCASNYRILLAEHDTCEEDVLDQIAETGIHDYEEPCETFNCNPLTDEADVAAQLICDNSSVGAVDSTVWLLYGMIGAILLAAF